MTFGRDCSNDDNLPEPELQGYSGVPLIILDTDIGSSTDDLFALMMLYRYQEQNKSRLLGVVVDREGEDFAACADVMNTYYGHGDIDWTDIHPIKQVYLNYDCANAGQKMWDPLTLMNAVAERA